MSVKTGALALVSGLATFFGVGIGVTAVTEHWIDFPLLLGLFAGTLAGLAATAGVSVGLTEGLSAGRRRIGGAVVGFGAGCVVALVAAASVDAVGSAGSVGIGFVGGVFAAAGVYAIDPL